MEIDPVTVPEANWLQSSEAPIPGRKGGVRCDRIGPEGEHERESEVRRVPGYCVDEGRCHSLAAMLRRNHQVVSERDAMPASRGAKLPPRANEAIHADHFSSMEGQADRGIWKVRICLVLPFEVRAIESGIATPEVPQQPEHLPLVATSIVGNFVS